MDVSGSESESGSDEKTSSSEEESGSTGGPDSYISESDSRVLPPRPTKIESEESESETGIFRLI